MTTLQGVLARLSANDDTLKTVNLKVHTLGEDDIVALCHALAKNSHVRELNLTDVGLSRASLAIVSDFLRENKTIHTLTIGENKLTADDIEPLFAMLSINTALQELRLDSNSLGVKGAVVLANALPHLKCLHSLSVRHNQLFDEGINELSNGLKNTILKKIDIGSNGITSKCIKNLMNVVINLTELDIQNNNIQSEGGSIIADSLISLKNLRVLSLRGNHIGNQGIISIANSLASNPNLQTLSLAENNVDDQSAVILAAALATNHNLRDLDLWHNKIERKGGEAIAECLMKNNSLTRLRLALNPLSVSVFSAISSSLAVNKSLLVLDLSDTSLTSNSFKDITISLTKNTTLERLFVSNNQIDDEGLCFLSQSLPYNATLIEISLSGNKIGNKGAKALIDSLLDNVALKIIDLDWISDIQLHSDIENAIGNIRSQPHGFILPTSLSQFPIHKAALTMSSSDSAIFTQRVADDSFGNSPLHYAAFVGNIIACRQLIPIYHPDHHNQGMLAPIHIVADDVEIVSLFLQSAPNAWKVKDLYQNNAIHYSIWHSHHNNLKTFIQHKVDVNEKNFVGWTPLFVACLLQDEIAVELLLNAGALVNVKDKFGRSPLFFSRTPTITALLQK